MSRASKVRKHMDKRLVELAKYRAEIDKQHERDKKIAERQSIEAKKYQMKPIPAAVAQICRIIGQQWNNRQASQPA